MAQIFYLSLSPQIRAQLTPDFWRDLFKKHQANKQRSANPLSPIACFSQQQPLTESLTKQLTRQQGDCLLIVLTLLSNIRELHQLEHQLCRLLAHTPKLQLKLLIYHWSLCLAPCQQITRLATLISTPQRQRQLLPVEVDFDPAWSSLPAYRYRLLLCNGARCAHRGSARLWKQLSQLLAQQNLLETPAGALLVKTHCQFPCNHGPVVTVYPGEYWYGIRQPADVRRLVEQHIKAGIPVNDLLLTFPTEV